MKKILLIIFSLLICGCNQEPKTSPVVEGHYDFFERMVIVDGCQYAVHSTSHAYNVYTHIGSCTNCWSKMEILIGKKLNTEKE